MGFIRTTIKQGFTFVREHPQLLATLVLVCVIPVAFILSSQQFLEAAKDNQERLENEKIGILHDTFVTILTLIAFDQTKTQDKLTEIAKLNVDITDFVVAHEDGPYLKIIASLDASRVGSFVVEPDLYRIANTHPRETVRTASLRDGVRYRQSYRLVRDTSHNEVYYIYTETSLLHIDALFAKRIAIAYYWLFGLLVIVMILVFRHVRLIDYSFLYAQTRKEIQSRDLFTNMIAHELRAPLTAMRGYASMIMEKKDVAPDIHEYARRIEISSERLVLIVNDLLDVARIHSGKLSVTPKRTDIQEIISSVLEAMQSSAEEKGILLSQEGFENPLFIVVDEKRFYQALTNLVSNSIKYTKAGGIKISLEELSDRVELRVKDTGTGISAENQKNLFSPFFRVDSISVEQTVGTGLGLWITKQLIELMRGTIAVESIKGVGTHIVVTLPKE